MLIALGSGGVILEGPVRVIAYLRVPRNGSRDD